MVYLKFKITLTLVLFEFIHKHYCTLTFPSLTGSGAYGIFGAIAVPLELPHRNVFVSYNFEANYNLPYLASDIFPGPLKRFEDLESRNLKDFNNTEDVLPMTTRKRSLITRNSFYKVLSDKFKYHGFHGKPCILKLICEASLFKLSENNGVIGQIVQILFTPSSSRDEKLSEDYYSAELDGLQNNCNKYSKICSQSVLELISVQIDNLINNIE